MHERLLAAALVLPVLSPLLASQGQPRTPEDPRSLPGDQRVTRPFVSPVVFEGLVLDENGGPAEGSVVVSGAGGEAVADSTGRYRLVVALPRGTDDVRLTAVGGATGRLVASTKVELKAAARRHHVPTLWLSRGMACSPAWLPTFGGGTGVQFGESVLASIVFDDGSGPALYVGGNFRAMAGVPVSYVARWDGSAWTAVGSGIQGWVYALAVFDDGKGPALHAAGSFNRAFSVANRIAKWSGTEWTEVGGGVDKTVRALAVYDDGRGDALYLGGLFTSAGGAALNRVARWDGSSWEALGDGVEGELPNPQCSSAVRALAVHDDGSGPALFVGGHFTMAGAAPASSIAKWDGTSWTLPGSGVTGTTCPSVLALTAHDDGGGPRLFAGGTFTHAGGVAASRIASWDGSSWAPLGSGVNSSVFGLGVHDDGSGPELYAGGPFTLAGGVSANSVAKWDGATWTPLGDGMDDHVQTLRTYDDGTGATLFAGGGFETAGDVEASGIARWAAGKWEALGTVGLSDQVEALAVYDDGGGPALFVGGRFAEAAGASVNHVAKWDGAAWTPLGSGTDASVFALAVFDPGEGPRLYVGGGFTTAGGVAASRVASWDGSSWMPLGSGLDGTVRAMVAYDDGLGPQLHVGGSFANAGGMAASRIAKWNGFAWNSLDGGVNSTVYALAADGDTLYAGGAFTTAGGAPAARIARWHLWDWSPLRGGANNTVYALVTADIGGGPLLYVGGDFSLVDGNSANRVASWDGSAWSPLGTGMDFVVRALAVHTDVTGTALYAGGSFTVAGGTPAARVARWDGADWGAVGGGMSPAVETLLGHDDGAGPALFAGGSFATANDSGDSFLARWGPVDEAAPVIDCPASIVVTDLDGSQPGEAVTFSVEAVDDCDPTPTVVCSPPSGSVFALGTTLVDCTATDGTGNQSACQFSVTVRLPTRAAPGER